jgi:hypothetical protein
MSRVKQDLTDFLDFSGVFVKTRDVVAPVWIFKI